MKTQLIKTTAILALAIVMVVGMNAQPRGGKGMGSCGQGKGAVGPGMGQGHGQIGQGHGPIGHGYEFGHGQAKLDLSEEQQEQLSALRIENYKTMKPLRAEMKELGARKQTLLAQEEVDVKAIHKVIDQQTGLTNKIQKKQLTYRLAFRELLTIEQVIKLDQGRMRKGNMMAQGGKGMHAHHRGQGYRR